MLPSLLYYSSIWTGHVGELECGMVTQGSITVLVCLAGFNEQLHVFIKNLDISGWLSRKTTKTDQAESNNMVV